MISKLVRLRNQCIYYYYSFLSTISRVDLTVDKNADFIVSIASYPKRDKLLPAVFQALSRQSCPPSRYILVLSDEEYPSRYLPKRLFKLQKRGLEILWVENNPYAVKKLVPVVSKYPNMNIVTLDDDFIYYRDILFRLKEGSKQYPNSIVGLAGKELYRINNSLSMFYRRKKPATVDTNPKCVYFLGGSGTFYPSNSLHPKFMDLDKIKEIIPGRGSDMWFWAAAHANNKNQICIGVLSKYSVGIPIPPSSQTQTRELPDRKILDEKFQKTIDYFNIREKLIDELPNKHENDEKIYINEP